jgi:hypothetical protein
MNYSPHNSAPAADSAAAWRDIEDGLGSCDLCRDCAVMGAAEQGSAGLRDNDGKGRPRDDQGRALGICEAGVGE